MTGCRSGRRCSSSEAGVIAPEARDDLEVIIVQFVRHPSPTGTVSQEPQAAAEYHRHRGGLFEVRHALAVRRRGAGRGPNISASAPYLSVSRATYPLGLPEPSRLGYPYLAARGPEHTSPPLRASAGAVFCICRNLAGFFCRAEQRARRRLSAFYRSVARLARTATGSFGTSNRSETRRDPHSGHISRLSSRESGKFGPRVQTSVFMSNSER